MDNNNVTSVLLGEPDIIVRKGIKLILEEQYSNIYIEEVSNSTDLLNKLAKSTWSILIWDLSMPDLSGLTMIKRVKSISPKTPMLILGQHPASKYSLRLLKVGASGYLTKEIAAEELVWAVGALQSGRMYLTDEVVDLLVESVEDKIEGASYKALSDKEFEILWHISTGRSLFEIADLLALSRNTISVSKSRILKKMQLNSDKELLEFSLLHGLYMPKCCVPRLRTSFEKQEVFN